MEVKTLVANSCTTFSKYKFWIEIYMHTVETRPYIDAGVYYSYRAWRTLETDDIPDWVGTSAGFETAAEAAFAAYEAAEQIKTTGWTWKNGK